MNAHEDDEVATVDELSARLALAKSVQSSHEGLLAKLRQKAQDRKPVKLAFFVCDRTKWNSQKLLDMFRADAAFSTSIVLVPQGAKVGHKRLEFEAHAKESAFYRAIEPDLIDCLDTTTGVLMDARELEFDVIFLQHPWGMKAVPKAFLGRALTVYTHYGYMVTFNPKLHYFIPGFHSYLWRYFCQSEAHRAVHLKARPELSWQLKIGGYPKLDGFDQPAPPENEKKFWGVSDPKLRVIYAPHHSIGKKNSFRLSTFDWNHNVFPSLRDEFPPVKWVYKPHSNLRFKAESQGVMNNAGYLAYENGWSDAENSSFYDSGDYFDLFKTSSVLITDCGSFLGEFMATGKPLIRLISRNKPVALHETGKAIDEVCYKAHNVIDIHKLFETVVLRGEDPLREKRTALKHKLFGQGFDSSSLIYEEVKSQLGL